METPLQAPRDIIFECLGTLWSQLRTGAQEAAEREPLLARNLQQVVLKQPGFDAALAEVLATRLADRTLTRPALRTLVGELLAEDPAIGLAAQADLCAVVQRDPASAGPLMAFLHFKGFHALQAHRVGHALYKAGRRELAFHMQSRISQALGVDIHPAVPIGLRVMIDHGTGVVIGETSVIGDDVSILQGVTLGGTGKESGDRHPKIRNGVLLAAGSTVLGNIIVGENAKVGAGSVVLHDVPPCATVAGEPARVVAWCTGAAPGLSMDQAIEIAPAARLTGS
jgi:serine O-acetyltransferase